MILLDALEAHDRTTYVIDGVIWKPYNYDSMQSCNDAMPDAQVIADSVRDNIQKVGPLDQDLVNQLQVVLGQGVAPSLDDMNTTVVAGTGEKGGKDYFPDICGTNS